MFCTAATRLVLAGPAIAVGLFFLFPTPRAAIRAAGPAWAVRVMRAAPE